MKHRYPKSRLHRLLRDPETVAYAVIGVNVLMFIVSLMLFPERGGRSPVGFLAPSGRSLLVLGGTGQLPIDVYHRWWTVLSANYLHGGVLHLMFNMAAFYQLAPAVGRIYGTARMFVLYTLTGVLASLVSYTAGTKFSIGASGAVCGLIGAVLIYGKLRGDDFGNAVYRQTLGWVIGIAVFGLLVPGIDNWGHGGGLLAGIGGGYLMGVRSRDTAFDPLIAAGCALAVIAVLIISPAPVIAHRFGL